MAKSYTVDELRKKLDEFEAELRAAGLRENSVETYVQRSATFMRWLEGDYKPGGPVG